MKRLLLALVLVLSFTLWAADKIQPLDVKTGLWESTVINSSSGMPPIPNDVLEKLTPEQRARMEEAMKARGAAGSHTTTTKSCVTKEKLEKSFAFGEERNQCSPNVVSSSSSKVKLKIHCVNDEMTTDGDIQFEAINSENVKGSVHMVTSGNGHTMTNNGTITARYLGPSCGNVK